MIDLIIMLCLIGVSLVVSNICWSMIFYKDINKHIKMAAIWAFIANFCILGFNIWLLGVFLIEDLI